MTYSQKITKLMTSEKTTGEIIKQLELLCELRKLRREIESTCDELCQKIDIMNEKLDEQMEDK